MVQLRVKSVGFVREADRIWNPTSRDSTCVFYLLPVMEMVGVFVTGSH